MSKIAIFGGTFNPIHNEHINLCLKSIKYFGFCKVFFSISVNPPHKESDTSFIHRYTMVNLAINRYKNFFPLTIEYEYEETKYTIELLKRFTELYNIKRENLFFLAGGDSLKMIKTWKNYEELLKNFRFIFVSRKSVNLNDEAKRIMKKFDIFDGRNERKSKYEKFLEKHHSLLVDFNLKDISSTNIRNMLKSNMDLSGFLPYDVLKYIRKNGVYEKKY